MAAGGAETPWPGDIVVTDLQRAGLSALRPCKIAAIEARHAEPLGDLPPAAIAQVAAAIRAYLGA